MYKAFLKALRPTRSHSARTVTSEAMAPDLSTPDPPAPPAPKWSADPPPTDRIEELTACPFCGGAPRTMVCPFNRFAVYEEIPDAQAPTYNYALCHTCGCVSATRRPAGARYDWLFDHFEATLGRADIEGAPAGKLAISSRALSEERREHLRRVASRGIFVSEHLGVSRKDYLPALFRDRAANSLHVDVIGSLGSLKAPRVLEVRSRLGTIPAGLTRLYGGEGYAMAIFESQQFLIQEIYGLPTAWPIDFQSFRIPFDGPFDVIVANHMLTHVHKPAEFLAEVHRCLAPGGLLYLYNETDEGEFLERGKSMISTFNPFHLQTFDRASLVRALAANGFATEFLMLHDGSFLCLARKSDQPLPWAPLDPRERLEREASYRKAWDIAVVRMPEHARWQVAAQWDDVVQRLLANGLARVSKQGDVRLIGKQG